MLSGAFSFNTSSSWYFKKTDIIAAGHYFNSYGNFNPTPDYYHDDDFSRHDLAQPARQFSHACLYLHLGLGRGFHLDFRP